MKDYDWNVKKINEMAFSAKMVKNKSASISIIFALLLLFCGCKKSESVDELKDLTALPSPTSAIAVTPTIRPAIEPSPSITPSITPTIKPTITPTVESSTTPAIAPAKTIPTLTQEELSMKAYEKFLKNETKVSFDRFMPKDDMGKAFYKKGSEYTLSEVLHIVTAYNFKYSTNKKVKYIDYCYIDCGNDGVNELVLRLNGMDIYDKNDDSTLVYIIKYIDGKLSLCYYYKTWARSQSKMNEYGYYRSGGSNGASNHSIEYGLIDKDGNWQFIVSIESELNINQLAMSVELGQIPKVAKTKGITGGIELDTIRFNENEKVSNSDEVVNKECFYTFYVFDDNKKPIKNTNLYTNSIYKEIFDEAKVPFITPDEISTLISEKEKKVGATAAIKEGTEMTWKVLGGNMFSDYVGR